MNEINELKNRIINQIKFMKSGSIEEMFLILSDALKLFFRCLILFGINNSITKECFKVIIEMKKILKEEKQLLNIMYSNIEFINLESAYEMVLELDSLNDDTYTSYNEILYNISDACTMKDKERIVRSNKPIDSLITNKEYKKKVISLINKKTAV